MNEIEHEIYKAKLEINELFYYISMTKAFQQHTNSQTFYDLYNLQLSHINEKIAEKELQVALFKELLNVE